MFQGSENLEKLAHFRYVQGSGGTFNGSTHLDYTDYFETLPANALERALFLEADRMRGPALTEENLRNQVDVVKEEIRVNVLNRPYGGLPVAAAAAGHVRHVPQRPRRLRLVRRPGVGDRRRRRGLLRRRYYAAGNAVLAVAGDFDVAEATGADRAALRRRAGPAGAAAPRLRRARPDRGAPREPTWTGWRRCRRSRRRGGCRTRSTTSTAYLPYVVLAEVLTDGDASRLVERLVLRDRTVTSVGGYVGFMGEPFAVRDPTALVLQAHLPPGRRRRRRCCAPSTRSSTGSPPTASRPASSPAPRPGWPPTCCATPTRCSAGRCSMAVLEQQRGDAGLINELPRLIGEVTEEQVVGRRGHAAPAAPRRRSRSFPEVPSDDDPARLPALGAEPRPLIAAARRPSGPLANGLTVIAIRAAAGAAGRAPAAGAVRPSAPLARAAALLSQTLLSGTATMSNVDIAAELQAVGGGAVRRRRPGPAADLRQRPGQRAGPDAGDPAPTCSPAPTYPAPEVTTERDRLVDRIQVAQQPALAPGPGGAAAPDLRPATRTRVQTPAPEQVARGRPRARCARCTPSGCTRPARPWSSSATSTRTGRSPRPSATLRRLGRRRRAGRAAADPAAEPGPAAAGRPARLGAVLAAAGAAGGRRARHPDHARAAAGQPGLRRLLLLPLGGEHPRGQGLHLRPALHGRALDRRLVG